MWMSNDRVPLENVESPYGGGVSSLPGAAGDLLPVMFPVAPVLLAGGPQLGYWQVAVVRVDETHAGDSSGREYPCAKQNRHRPIDMYELPDGLGHTVVEGGPVGIHYCSYSFMYTLLDAHIQICKTRGYKMGSFKTGSFPFRNGKLPVLKPNIDRPVPSKFAL